MSTSSLPDPTIKEIIEANNNNLSGSLPTSLGQLVELSEWVDDACTTTGTWCCGGIARRSLCYSLIGHLCSAEVLDMTLNLLRGSIPNELDRLGSLDTTKQNPCSL